jgi:histidine triad (HIT) family protein
MTSKAGPVSGHCPFCSTPDARTMVYQDEATFAVVDIAPINPYHTMVIPKVHYTTFIDMPTDVVSRMFLIVQRISGALRAVCQPDAITHVLDDDLTGQGFNLIAHLKVHLIPRNANDRVRIDWNRPPAPPPAERERYARELRDALR